MFWPSKHLNWYVLIKKFWWWINQLKISWIVVSWLTILWKWWKKLKSYMTWFCWWRRLIHQLGIWHNISYVRRKWTTNITLNQIFPCHQHHHRWQGRKRYFLFKHFQIFVTWITAQIFINTKSASFFPYHNVDFEKLDNNTLSILSCAKFSEVFTQFWFVCHVVQYFLRNVVSIPNWCKRSYQNEFINNILWGHFLKNIIDFHHFRNVCQLAMIKELFRAGRGWIS